MNFTLNETFQQNFVVTENVYTGFIDLFNDKNPLHTNREFALEKKFNEKVMHGNILNGFISYFIGECLPVKNVIIHSQEIQYKNAVYLNNALQFEAIVSGIYESVNAIEFKFNFKNEAAVIVAKGKIQIGVI